MNAKELAEELRAEYKTGKTILELPPERGGPIIAALERCAELEQRYALLSGEVAAWICTSCHEAFPPAKLNPGLMCLACPRCDGATMTQGRYEMEEERNRANRLQARCAELEADAERYRTLRGILKSERRSQFLQRLEMDPGKLPDILGPAWREYAGAEVAQGWEECDAAIDALRREPSEPRQVE